MSRYTAGSHRPLQQAFHHVRMTIGAVLLSLVLITSVMPPHSTRAQPASPAAAADDWPQFRHDIQRSGRASTALARSPTGALHLQWAYSLGERVEVPVEPIVAGGLVFVGAMNGTMTALNAADGRVAWTFQAGPIPATAAYADGRVFFGSLDGAIYALDAASGRRLWSYATGGPVVAAPAVANGTVYIGSTGGRFLALDAASGAVRWRFPSGDPALPAPFTGPAALSPDGSRVFVGNEDRIARALDATSGTLLWERPLTGVGMRGVHPIVADNGGVVIFQTTKPGVQSYLPTENYPDVAPGNDPAATWNRYYQTYPDRRATFFLRASDGAELWDRAGGRYVPLPLPYWGLLAPVLDSRGNAWLPVPGGAKGSGFGPYYLDHDSRLVRVDLGTGIGTEVAVRDTFQHHGDENGRATLAGDEYITTISEDVGTYNLATGAKGVLFGNGFGSHMDPIGPLPSKHLWRYGGVIAMGGVPGASPAVVAGGTLYYISYGWLFALGPTDRGKNPNAQRPIPFQSRDTRASVLTYPRAEAPAPAGIREELERRVADLIAAGDLPPVAKFEQAGGQLQDDISGFQLFGLPGERIWLLSRALPQLRPDLANQAKAYLRTLAQKYLFDPVNYQYTRDCLVYGQPGIKNGAACEGDATIRADWLRDNELLIGERLYAMAAYSEATGDWSLVDANWTMIKGLFGRFTAAYDSTLGFCKFPKWRTGKLGIASQIGAAAGTLRMANHRGDTATTGAARTLLDNLLATQVRLGHYMRDRYDAGQETPLPMRLDPDGVPNNGDIFKYNDPGELIPLNGDRTRDSDVRQVNWSDGNEVHTHSTAGIMHYATLVGANPLYPELADTLRSDLLPEIRQYVQTYEVNAPWWWMSDLAYHTTAGGEHLWHSPTLAHDLFQVKAWVLREDWETLRRQLPEPMSINPRYDLYRIDNLATLLALGGPDLSPSSLTTAPAAAKQGATVQTTFTLNNAGGPIDAPVNLTITLPPELTPETGSAIASGGSVTLAGNTVRWSGTPGTARVVTIGARAKVTTAAVRFVTVTAHVEGNGIAPLDRAAPLVLNGRAVSLPAVRR